jgi:hypothetical protein
MSWRVDYAFRGGELSVTRVGASRQAAPGSDPILPGAWGFWLTVHDAGGRQVHAQILRDPRTGAVGIPDQGGWAFVPDPGAGGSVVFHMAFPAVDEAFSSDRILVAPLKPKGGGARTVEEAAAPVWLLILGDGFAAAERPVLRGFAEAVIERLCAMAPFERHAGRLRAAIAVADGPERRGGAFGWRDDDRLADRVLMMVDRAKVAAHVRRELQLDPVNVLVVRNDARYGGSGGDPAVTGIGAPGPGGRAAAIEAAIHEVGHSAFALADEYDTPAPGHSSAPVELNVAHDVASVRAKWGALLTPGVALPTPDGAPAGTVGMFRGAKYDPDNNYRAQQTCRMRFVTLPYCAACRQVIDGVLAAELPG